MPSPTSADVARLAKVSRATVSYVLNQVTSQKISDQTRKAVIDAAEELGYRPNRAAVSLRSGESDVVMFVIPRVHLGEMAIEISGLLTSRAAARGVTIMTHFDDPAGRSVADVARDLHPRVVLSILPLADPVRQSLAHQGIRVASVIVEASAAALGADHSGPLQVGHLVDRGHTVIAFADSDDPELALFRTGRRLGVSEECRRRGLRAPPVASFAITGGGERHVREWAESGVTAVAAYNDEIAIAVLAAIRRAGLRCPDDLAVIGVDDLAIDAAMDPPLSSVALDVEELARVYAERLTTAIDGGELASGGLPDDPAFYRIVPRRSTANTAVEG